MAVSYLSEPGLMAKKWVTSRVMPYAVGRLGLLFLLRGLRGLGVSSRWRALVGGRDMGRCTSVAHANMQGE